jgi:hypothetical protein
VVDGRFSGGLRQAVVLLLMARLVDRKVASKGGCYSVKPVVPTNHLDKSLRGWLV